jgi:hypothetical protein
VVARGDGFGQETTWDGMSALEGQFR